MITFDEYIKPDTLEEAWELNQKKGYKISGGNMWLSKSHKNYKGIIDLSGLGLSQITQTDDEYVIGAMVNLNQLILHEDLDEFSDGTVKKALKPIVGVQFRNMASVGGSIFARLGFSDVLTLLMVFDTRVRLYKGGDVKIDDFANKGGGDDILTHIVIKKDKGSCFYQAVRKTKTDLPILNLAARKTEKGYKVAVGARPKRAVLLEGESLEEIKNAAEKISFEDNLKASAAYRKHLFEVMLENAVSVIGGVQAED